MRTKTVLAAATAAAILPATALAAKPPKPTPKPTPAPTSAALSLTVSATPIVFPGAVTISGTLAGVAPLNGVSVSLEQDDTRPYGDSYKPAGVKTTTTATGGYAFTLRPARNTQYRAVAKTGPAVTSGPRLVNVRPAVGLKASTRTPKANRIVRFSGLVQPARTGAVVLLQRRTSTGGFATVARGTLRASTPGSVFTIPVRVRRSGSYRVKLPGNQELVNGFSRTLRITTR